MLLDHRFYRPCVQNPLSCSPRPTLHLEKTQHSGRSRSSPSSPSPSDSHHHAMDQPTQRSHWSPPRQCRQGLSMSPEERRWRRSSRDLRRGCRLYRRPIQNNHQASLRSTNTGSFQRVQVDYQASPVSARYARDDMSQPLIRCPLIVGMLSAYWRLRTIPLSYWEALTRTRQLSG